MLRNTRRRLIGAASGSVERGDVRRRKRGARRGSTRLKWRRAHVSTPSATTYKWVAQRVQLTVPHGAERHPPRHPSRSAVCSTARRHAPSATRAVAASHGTNVCVHPALAGMHCYTIIPTSSATEAACSGPNFSSAVYSSKPFWQKCVFYCWHCCALCTGLCTVECGCCHVRWSGAHTCKIPRISLM